MDRNFDERHCRDYIVEENSTPGEKLTSIVVICIAIKDSYPIDQIRPMDNREKAVARSFTVAGKSLEGSVSTQTRRLIPYLDMRTSFKMRACPMPDCSKSV